MNDFPEYNLWRDNFLGAFRNITSDEDFKKLASYYPFNDYNSSKCKQRKNNLLRSGNRNIYLDDLYAMSRYSDKTPDNLLLGHNNISYFWSELNGENLFENECIEKIVGALKSDKNYRTIYIPKEIEDFLYYSKSVIFEVNNKKIRKPIFNINDNSLDFKTTGECEYSYNPNLFYGGDVYDVLCDYLIDLRAEDFPEFEKEKAEKFLETINVYLDSGKAVAKKSDKDINFRIKNWVCNCTMWLLLSYIGDTCERQGENVEYYLRNHREVIAFMLKLFVFGTEIIKQKRITDELTNEKKRVRYSAFMSCSNENLIAIDEDFDYYDYDLDYKTASISDMQKSSLSEILDYELR